MADELAPVDVQLNESAKIGCGPGAASQTMLNSDRDGKMQTLRHPTYKNAPGSVSGRGVVCLRPRRDGIGLRLVNRTALKSAKPQRKPGLSEDERDPPRFGNRGIKTPPNLGAPSPRPMIAIDVQYNPWVQSVYCTHFFTRLGGPTAVADKKATSGDPSDKEPRETIVSETGAYSRIMKEDEYREWVRQTVSGQIWGRMTAIFSAIGFAAIIAMFTYVSNVSNSAIEAKIGLETKKLNEEVKKLNEEVEKKLPSVVNHELSSQIRNNNLIPAISESAVKQITENKGVESALQNLVISQSLKLLMDPSQSSLRAVALQQILLFGDERQKVDAIASVILDEKSGDQEFTLALQNYPSHQPKSNVDQRQSLHNILERGAIRSVIFSSETWAAIEQILKKESDIRESCAWIKNAATTPRSKYSANSLRTMVGRIAKVGGTTAAEQFVGWMETGDDPLRDLGWFGLTAFTPPEDTSKRQGLAVRLARSLAASSNLPHDGSAEYLSTIAVAVRLKDKAILRRFAENDFASPRIKDLIAQLIVEPDNREAWNFATRNLTSSAALQTYGGYGQYEKNQSAYQLIGKFLDVSAGSTDWDKVIRPRIEEAAGKWTSPSQANFLVAAWVTTLQKSNLPSQASLNVAADLFVEAHMRRDPDLILYNSPSYRYLMSRADDAIFRRFMARAATIAGISNEGNEEANRNEAGIFAEAIARFLREDLSANGVMQMRASFSPDANKHVIERSSTIWLSAAKQQIDNERAFRFGNDTAISDGDLFSMLVERLRKGSGDTRSAAALLALVSNRGFLQLKKIQDAAEQANLHLLSEDVGRLRSDSFVNDLAQAIAVDTRSAIGWIETLAQRAKPVGSELIPLDADTIWLTLDPSPGQVVEVSIDPPTKARYTLIGSSNRVYAVQTPNIPRNSAVPVRFTVRGEEPGKQVLRIDSISAASLSAQPKIQISALPSFRATDLLPSKKGGSQDLELNRAVNIETKGRDEAWLRVGLKANGSYTMRTRALQPDDVDTVIEVYDRTETQKLQDDDDGGEEAGGQTGSSRLVLSPPEDAAYHVRIRNIDRKAGSFVFEVLEDSKEPK